MIVDLEHHFRVARQGVDSKVERAWTADGVLQYSQGNSGADVDEHLSFMDRAGIDLAVLSGNLPDHLPIEAVRIWNDTCARAVSDHPSRFAGFACTKPAGGDDGFAELDRAVGELGMKGVHIGARPGGHFLDARELWPFYEKVAQLDIPIDVHVETYPSGFEALKAPYILSYVMARELDITATVLRLCFGGVLEDFPDLKIIVNHFGGGIASIKERMDYYVGLCAEDTFQNEALISQPWNHYFDKLYFNMAGRGPGINSLKCALTCIKPEKLMFGSDWPPNFETDPAGCKQYIEDIKALDLPKADIEAMLGGNAVALLGLPAG